MTDDSGTLTAKNFTIHSATSRPSRLSMLLWGPSGVGKTVWAATAPGTKLIVNFDPDGPTSLGARDDVMILDLSQESPSSWVREFAGRNPLDIATVLENNPHIETVIMDSLTMFGEAALSYGVEHAAQFVKAGQKPSLEEPGQKGYGRKNTWMNSACTNMLNLTRRYNRHIIFTGHEGTPEKNNEGSIVAYHPNLGSSLKDQIPVKISEMWYMRATSRTGAKIEREVAIKPVRMRSPMKTRMFHTEGQEPEFPVSYNDDTGEGLTIAQLYEWWRDNSFNKIAPPK